MDLIIKQIYTARFDKQLTFKTKKIKKDRVIIECRSKTGVVGTIVLKKVEKGVVSYEEYMEHLEDYD